MFFKYFFLHGGLLVNFELSTNSYISNQLELEQILNSESKLLRLEKDNYHQSLLEDGIRITIRKN
jgi:hypothetical protein